MVEAELVSFGAWLQARRLALGLTQKELGRRAGCAEATIRKIEADERRPSAVVAALIAEQLGLPPSAHDSFVRAARGELRTAQLGDPAQLAHTDAAPLVITIDVPAPLTPLVGREALLEALTPQLARTETRLVTLLGPAGVGKTRLALALAEALRPAFADAMVFLALTPLTAPDQLLPALAHALAIPTQPDGELLRQIAQRLRPHRALLVLDNCEHLPGLAPMVSELLRAAPRLSVLATSRSRLQISGEQLVPIAPLALPPPGPPANLETFVRIPAVVLLLQRVQALAPTFALTEESAAVFGAICRQLDGLPLALELAAVRVPQLGLARVAAQLQEHAGALTLLSEGPRDLPARQQAVRAALDWSYSLLMPAARAALAWLAPCVGSTHQEAALALLARAPLGPHGDLAPWEQLTALADASLLRRELLPDGVVRLSWLEIVRAYALTQLSVRGEVAQATRAHAEVYAEFAERAAARLPGPEQETALRDLDEAAPNLRAALTWCLETREHTLALRIAGVLGSYWWQRDAHHEGVEWLMRALTLVGWPDQLAAACPAELQLARERARLIAQACVALHMLLVDDQPEQALQACEIGLAYGRRAGQPSLIGRLLTGLGYHRARTGHHPEASMLFAEADACLHAAGDLSGQGEVAYGEGLIALEHGQLDQADAHLQYSLRHFRQAGNTYGVMLALVQLARVSQLLPGHTTALERLRDAVAFAHASRNTALQNKVLPVLTALQLNRDEDAAVATSLAAWRAASEGQNDTVARTWIAFWEAALGQHQGALDGVVERLERSLAGFRIAYDLPGQISTLLLMERQALLAGGPVAYEALRRERSALIDRLAPANVMAEVVWGRGLEHDALASWLRGDSAGARRLLEASQAALGTHTQRFRRARVSGPLLIPDAWAPPTLRLGCIALAQQDGAAAGTAFGALLDALQARPGRRIGAGALLGVAALLRLAGRAADAAGLVVSAEALLDALSAADPLWLFPEVRALAASLAPLRHSVSAALPLPYEAAIAEAQRLLVTHYAVELRAPQIAPIAKL